MSMDLVTLKDIEAAAERIKDYAVHTPLLRCSALDEALGCEVYLKPEMLQTTGAFKLRGAANSFMSLTEEMKEKGVICSSAGNHARACGTMGKLLGIKTVVVVPEDIPQAKFDAIKATGAEIHQTSRQGGMQQAKVEELVAQYGYESIHPTNDVRVIAGQGTVGLEIMQDLPNVDTILVPVGGAGLISGVGIAAKSINPKVKVIGIQAKANDAYTQSWKAGKPVEASFAHTIADGLDCRIPGSICFPLAMKYVDEYVSVEEDVIHEAVRLVIKESKLMAEPSSCVGVAAILGGLYKPQPGEKVAFVLTAGNWGIDRIGAILKGEQL